MEVKIIVQDKENKEMHINEYENFAELLVDVVNKLDLDVSEVIIKKRKYKKGLRKNVRRTKSISYIRYGTI